jgi:hypothetical protein
MRRVAAKLAFIHRTLWQRNQAYRWAVLLGPPPLLGCALAALGLIVWRQLPHAASAPSGDVPWAHWTPSVARDAQPYAEAPMAALPKRDSTGRMIGFQPGWLGDIRPMILDATMDANVIDSTIANFALDGPTISLARISDAGPPGGLFMGLAKSFFVVQTPGLYAFSAQLTWSGTQSANCMVRFASGHHGMIRNINLNVASGAVLSYAPTVFRLEPGLTLLQAGAVCWRGDHVVVPGTVTVLVRRPGELVLTPVTAKEVIRPLQRSAAGVR